MPVAFPNRDFPVVMRRQLCRQGIDPAVKERDIGGLVRAAKPPNPQGGHGCGCTINRRLVFEDRCAGSKGTTAFLAIRIGNTRERLYQCV